MMLRVGIPSIGMRASLSQYEQYRNAAITAARNNNAALWYAGAAADLAGFVYQDSTGTTAATGTDPIGLMLDRSYGTGNLGPERVTNGDFSNGSTGWSASGTGAIISVSSGQMTVTNGAAVEAGAVPTGSVEIGKTYFVSCRRVSGMAPGFVVLGSQNLPISGAAGIKSGVVGPITGSTGIRVATGNATLNDAITFDDLSIREVFGYSALQATAANKPTLELQANGYYGMRFDGVNDVLLSSLLLGAEAEIGTSIKFNAANEAHLMGDIPGSVDSGVLLTSNSTGAAMQSFTPGVSVSSVISGAPVVLSGWAKTGELQELRVSGVLTVGTSSNLLAAVEGLRLGSSPSGFGFSSGTHGAFWASPTKLSDADRFAIERFAALLSGASYV